MRMSAITLEAIFSSLFSIKVTTDGRRERPATAKQFETPNYLLNNNYIFGASISC